MSDEEIREAIREEQALGESYRRLEQRTGISASTICRFQNNKGSLSGRCRNHLVAYLSGVPMPKRKPIDRAIFRVDGHTFLVTIERLENNGGDDE